MHVHTYVPTDCLQVDKMSNILHAFCHHAPLIGYTQVHYSVYAMYAVYSTLCCVYSMYACVHMHKVHTYMYTSVGLMNPFVVC